jgi:hypothetical protein
MTVKRTRSGQYTKTGLGRKKGGWIWGRVMWNREAVAALSPLDCETDVHVSHSPMISSDEGGRGLLDAGSQLLRRPFVYLSPRLMDIRMVNIFFSEPGFPLVTNLINVGQPVSNHNILVDFPRRCLEIASLLYGVKINYSPL